jgi:putative phosphoesterase
LEVSAIGVISDTHGLLRPEVLHVFKHVDMILHAGDIGHPEVLQTLETLAPVVAVRGNNDHGDWAAEIPETRLVTVRRFRVYIIHDVKEFKPPAGTPVFDVVISGHSHQPRIERREGILFLNPGSAGPRRFKLPVTVARLNVLKERIDANLIPLL